MISGNFILIIKPITSVSILNNHSIHNYWFSVIMFNFITLIDKLGIIKKDRYKMIAIVYTSFGPREILPGKSFNNRLLKPIKWLPAIK